jgi:hypothetical protein
MIADPDVKLPVRDECHEAWTRRRDEGQGRRHRVSAYSRARRPPSRLIPLPRDQVRCYSLARLGTNVGKPYEIMLVDRSQVVRLRHGRTRTTVDNR